MSVRKAALFVSAPALMSMSLVLTSCSENERVATPTDTTSTRITDSTDVATDTGQSFYGEISDWEEEKGEVMPTGGSEKGGDL